MPLDAHVIDAGILAELIRLVARGPSANSRPLGGLRSYIAATLEHCQGSDKQYRKIRH